MAIQTLNTIKNWFKTGLKPSQQQFWDTWDSFRHKFEKVPVKDIEGIDELLLSKADKTILDNHLADKNAHAPQVNTDWNSESGFSQLLNKPEFKTINGQEIIGEGDITISSAIPTLDQVLNSDNKSLTQPIVFLDEEHSSSIDSKNLSINGPLEEVIQYNGDNISWSKEDKNLKLLFDRESTGQNTFSFPEMPDSSTPYKLATDQVVSATQSGIVDNTPLQDLGGVDKLINTVRVGRGNLVSTTNTVFGRNSLGATITGGTNNTAIGSNVMNLATTAPANTGVGSFSLNALTTGSSNVGIGASSLRTITTGSFNMGVGNATLQKIITASHNTAIGAHAGSRITGSKNTAIGFLSQGMSGPDSTGESNITIGLQAGGQLTSGSNNVLIENQETPGSTITSGSNNVILKQGSTSTGVITGNNNTIIGNATGLNSDASNLAILSDGSGNIALRKEADNRLLAPTLTNALIDSGGAKSLVTKEYLDAHSEGGSQNLDEILDNGNIATGKFIRLNEDANLQTNSVDIKFDKTVYRDKQQGTPSTEYDKNSITKFDVVLQDVISDFDFSVGVGNFKLPVKTKGSDYTLATTDDITGGSQNLQQTIDNGGIAIVGNQVEGNKISYVAITDENIILNNNIVDLDISSGITMGNRTGLKLGYSKPSLGFTTIVEFEEPTKGNSLLFPNKSGTLATTEDFKTINGQSIVGTGDIPIGVGDQNNFVRLIFVDIESLPEKYSTQHIIDKVLSLPANKRTIGDTDSLTNIVVGYPANETDSAYAVEVYEIQNTGKGEITSLLEENVLFKTGGLDKVLERSNIAIDKNLQLNTSNGYVSSTVESGVISVSNNYTSGNLILDATLPNNPRLLYSKNDRSMSIDMSKISVANYPNEYTINFPDPALVASNDLNLHFPIDMPNPGDYTLAIRDDIKLKNYKVSTLPSGVIGDHAYVTDATAPTYLGTLTGGGSIVCPVFYNGKTWVSY